MVRRGWRAEEGVRGQGLEEGDGDEGGCGEGFRVSL